MPGKRSAISLVAALCGLFGACGSGGTYLMFENNEILGDEKMPAGSGCMLAFPKARGGSVSTAGGKADGDFSHSEMRVGSKFVVVIGSQGEELARREYDEEQLLSGKRDLFTVTTLTGHIYELVYWGGTECEEPDGE